VIVCFFISFFNHTRIIDYGTILNLQEFKCNAGKKARRQQNKKAIKQGL